MVVFTRCESGDFPGPSVWYPLPRRGGQGGSLCAVDPITQPASVICFFLPTFRCGAGVGWATRWQSLGPLARVSHDSTRDLGWLEEDEHGWLSLLLGIRRGSWRVMVDTYLTWLCLRPWPFHPGALHFSICCPNAQQVVWRALVSPVHVHLRMDCRYLRLSSFFTVVNALPIIYKSSKRRLRRRHLPEGKKQCHKRQRAGILKMHHRKHDLRAFYPRAPSEGGRVSEPLYFHGDWRVLLRLLGVAWSCRPRYLSAGRRPCTSSSNVFKRPLARFTPWASNLT